MKLLVSETYADYNNERHESIARVVTTREEFLKKIVDVNSNKFFSVSSQVKKPWFKPAVHVPLLDCDGTAELFALVSNLRMIKIGYALIQSSPSHYWVIVDKIGRFSDLHLFATGLPGVDHKYLDMALRYEQFTLRMIPYTGKMALFEGSDNLTEPLVKKWYDEFEKLWRSPQVIQRYRAEALKAKMADGSILTDAADPEFQL